MLVVNNLLQTVSALAGGLVCGLVALSAAPGRRGGWAAMAVALVGWGAGQAYWSWSEIIAAAETPFPSPADLGFLVFPAAAAVAVLLFQRGTSASRSGLRAATDGLIVATSIFIVTGLGARAVKDAGGETSFGFAVALAYPISDVVLVALLCCCSPADRVAVAHGAALHRPDREGVADSGFAYMSTAGTYHTGSVIDVGWISLFLLCAVAAVADTEVADRGTATA